MSTAEDTSKVATYELIVDVYLSALDEMHPECIKSEYWSLLRQMRSEVEYSDEEMLDFLETMHPEIGHPYDYYHNVYQPDDEAAK